jgi:SAM-dependent methyltransferase
MDTKAFFDRHAPLWDTYQTAETHAALARIFDTAELPPGLRVLDVGSGTGILYPYFQAARAGAYTGLDVSPEMVRLFKAKHPEAAVIEADFESPSPALPSPFDLVMIFNTFPHLRDEEAVFSRARSLLAPGGRLMICHSMSREALNGHHRQAGGAVAEDVLISDSRFRLLYRRAGFASVRVENGDFFYSEGTA